MKEVLRKRIFALGLDLLILTVVISLVSMFYMNNPSFQIARKVLTEFSQVSLLEYTNNLDDVMKAYRALIGENIIEFILYFSYFVVMPFLNDGQTIGKKVMKIKIVSSKGDLTLMQMITRSLFTPQFNLLADLIYIVFIFILEPIPYLAVIFAAIGLSLVINMITIFMVYMSGDNRGIHEIISSTKIIELKEVSEKRFV
jgi:uncharacterized RDD family membrane protein YckC